MARNSYFLQGSESEQRLVQDLINEQLKIYGLDITYIPRKFVNTKSIHFSFFKVSTGKACTWDPTNEIGIFIFFDLR